GMLKLIGGLSVFFFYQAGDGIRDRNVTGVQTCALPISMSDHSGGNNKDGKLLFCSFCNKSQHQVRKLIAGPSVFICDECVDLCNDIIREEISEDNAKEAEDRL